MTTGPDSLLTALCGNEPDLQRPSGYPDKMIRMHGVKKVEALKKLGFLKVAPCAAFTECPEPGCFCCSVAVEEKNGNLYALCSDRADIARIPIKPEDVQQSRVDFFAVAATIANSFGLEFLNGLKDEQIRVCYLNGNELLLTPGAPVCVQIADRTAVLADCFRWTGSTFAFIKSRVENLLPAQKGKSETTVEKYCRILRLFMGLKQQEPGVEARYRLMAPKLNCSFSEVKRLVQSAKKKPAVLQSLGIAEEQKNYL